MPYIRESRGAQGTLLKIPSAYADNTYCPAFAWAKGEILDKREAEYWRGYGEGVDFRIRQRMGEPIRDHYRLFEEGTGENGDSCADAHAQGYRDGCKEEAISLVLPPSDRQRAANE